MNETVLPVCAPGYMDLHGIETPEQLVTAPLIQLSSRPDAWADWFQSQNIHAVVGSEIVFDQFAAAAQAAIHGIGLALLPEFLIEQELAEGRLVQAFDYTQLSKEAYYFVWPTRRGLFPPLIAFRDWVLKTVRSHPNGSSSGGSSA